jgi:hypothetical protein
VLVWWPVATYLTRLIIYKLGALDIYDPAGNTIKMADSDINAYIKRSPYNGLHSYWLFSTCNGGQHMYCSTKCTFNAKAEIVNTDGDCYVCSKTDGGNNIISGAPNTGTRGIGHHHIRDDIFAWQRHPEAGNNCGFKSDSCGSGDGWMYIR